MNLSKAGYYSDFWVYPLLLVPLGAVLWDGTGWQQTLWGFACLSGVVGWTLLEYVMHRVLFLHVAPFRAMHNLHHAAPAARVGTPTWVSATVIGCGVFLPLWWHAGVYTSSGFTFGFVVGYLWYGLLHHAIHRWRAHDGSYLHRAKRHHSQHHHAKQSCNFGVTTAFWDRLFGSAQFM